MIVSNINGVNNKHIIIDNTYKMQKHAALRVTTNQGLACITPFKIMRTRYYSII